MTHWKARQLHGGMEWDSAVYPLQGEAREAGESRPWSLILKAVQPSEKASHPDGIWYWKREVLAYQSGMLHRLPGGNFTAPQCYQASERPDGSIWLLLEDVKDDIAQPWPIERYAIVARQLGQFNWAYLVGQPLPGESWITHHWLRRYVEHATEAITFIRSNPYHPVVQHMFPSDSPAQVLAVWEERAPVLDLLENLPQVFCHQDAFRRNLFTRQGKILAIDVLMGASPRWARSWWGVAGFFEIPAARVREMDRLCFEGYLQRLHEAGWNGNTRLVRIGYAVTLMMRYPIGGQVGELQPAMLDKESRSRMENVFDQKTASGIEHLDSAIADYYKGMLPEAIRLMGMR